MTTGTALDPGTRETAWVDFDTTKTGADFITGAGHCANGHLLEALGLCMKDVLVIERMKGFGRFGDDIIQTLIWSGRFAQAFGFDRTHWVTRAEVIKHVCAKPVAKKNKDGQVARAMQERFGAKGTQANRGGTYGFNSHIYQALGVAVTYADLMLPKTLSDAPGLKQKRRSTNHTSNRKKALKSLNTTTPPASASGREKGE